MKRSNRRSKRNTLRGDDLQSGIVANAQLAVELFKKEMQNLFPQFLTKAAVVKIIGVEAVVVIFANVQSEKDAPNQILDNASGFMKFLLSLSDNRGKLLPDNSPVAVEVIRWNTSEKLKFRKIKAATPVEALHKLYLWFEKNQNIISSL